MKNTYCPGCGANRITPDSHACQCGFWMPKGWTPTHPRDEESWRSMDRDEKILALREFHSDYIASDPEDEAEFLVWLDETQ